MPTPCRSRIPGQRAADAASNRLVSQASHSQGQHVGGILEWSQSWNKDADITGLLCLLDSVYMQYLEGDEVVMGRLFDSIRQDGRHTGVAQLEGRAVSRRMFAG